MKKKNEDYFVLYNVYDIVYDIVVGNRNSFLWK